MKELIVEPGAFRAGSYASIKGTSAANETGQPGDPDKAGKVIADIEDCPERLRLGSD